MNGVTKLLRAAISQRVISPDDAVIAARISLFGQVTDASVVLAFALAIAAPKRGSACVDLYDAGLDRAPHEEAHTEV
jgi:hypothetical protein